MKVKKIQKQVGIEYELLKIKRNINWCNKAFGNFSGKKITAGTN